MVGFQTVIREGNNAVQLGFEVFWSFFSYEIALVIVAGDAKFTICVALSLSSVFHKKKPNPKTKKPLKPRGILQPFLPGL